MSILLRIPFSRFSGVVPYWTQKTAVIIGGGPSLTRAQVDVVARAHAAGKVGVIAVNDAYLLAPFADVLYFADDKWHRWHCEGEKFRTFAGQKCSISLSIDATNAEATPLKDEAVHILRRGPEWGLSGDPGTIHTGRNGGFQALNIAVLAGAKSIALLGIDCKPAADKTHWFGGHPIREPAQVYDLYRIGFQSAVENLQALEVHVVNCSPDSALNCFEKAPIESVLSHSRSTLVPA